MLAADLLGPVCWGVGPPCIEFVPLVQTDAQSDLVLGNLELPGQQLLFFLFVRLLFLKKIQASLDLKLPNRWKYLQVSDVLH